MTEIQEVEQAPKPTVKKPIKQLSDTDTQSIYDPKNLSTDERKVKIIKLSFLSNFLIDTYCYVYE